MIRIAVTDAVSPMKVFEVIDEVSLLAYHEGVIRTQRTKHTKDQKGPSWLKA